MNLLGKTIVIILLFIIFWFGFVLTAWAGEDTFKVYIAFVLTIIFLWIIWFRKKYFPKKKILFTLAILGIFGTWFYLHSSLSLRFSAYNTPDIEIKELTNFGKIAGNFSFSSSPNGQYLAYVGKENNEYFIFLYDIKNDKRKKVISVNPATIFEDEYYGLHIPSLEWSSDGKNILFIEANGKMTYQSSGKLLWDKNTEITHICSIENSICNVNKASSTNEILNRSSVTVQKLINLNTNKNEQKANSSLISLDNKIISYESSVSDNYIHIPKHLIVDNISIKEKKHFYLNFEPLGWISKNEIIGENKSYSNTIVYIFNVGNLNLMGIEKNGDLKDVYTSPDKMKTIFNYRTHLTSSGDGRYAKYEDVAMSNSEGEKFLLASFPYTMGEILSGIWSLDNKNFYFLIGKIHTWDRSDFKLWKITFDKNNASVNKNKTLTSFLTDSFKEKSTWTDKDGIINYCYSSKNSTDCIKHKAVVEKDVNLCPKDPSSTFEECVYNIAQTGDIKTCDLLPPFDSKNLVYKTRSRDYCIAVLARFSKDPNYCNILPKNNMKDECWYVLAQALEEPYLCNNVILKKEQESSPYIITWFTTTRENCLRNISENRNK